jgi:hypothetical protein
MLCLTTGPRAQVCPFVVRHCPAEEVGRDMVLARDLPAGFAHIEDAWLFLAFRHLERGRSAQGRIWRLSIATVKISAGNELIRTGAPQDRSRAHVWPAARTFRRFLGRGHQDRELSSPPPRRVFWPTGTALLRVPVAGLCGRGQEIGSWLPSLALPKHRRFAYQARTRTRRTSWRALLGVPAGPRPTSARRAAPVPRRPAGP